MREKTATKKCVYTFDIDGVLADTAPLAVKFFNEKFNKHKKVADLKAFFIIFEWIKEIVGNEEKATDETINVWNDHKVLSMCKPIKDAVEIVNELIRSDKEVRLITSRPNYTKEITFKWLGKWFPEVKKEFVHMCSKPGGHQRSFKAEMIAELKSNVHFEDSIEHISDILTLSPKTKIVLIRQPWNSNNLSNLSNSVIVPESLKRADIKASYEHYCHLFQN